MDLSVVLLAGLLFPSDKNIVSSLISGWIVSIPHCKILFNILVKKILSCLWEGKKVIDVLAISLYQRELMN